MQKRRVNYKLVKPTSLNNNPRQLTVVLTMHIHRFPSGMLAVSNAPDGTVMQWTAETAVYNDRLTVFAASRIKHLCYQSFNVLIDAIRHLFHCLRQATLLTSPRLTVATYQFFFLKILHVISFLLYETSSYLET
jgi:hypothetical protein